MTAISIWCNQEVGNNPSLWIVADSKVSSADGATLIEDAAKIFSLPIVCKAPGSDGFFSNTYYTHTLGYCFAGSTLMGQNAFLGLTPLLTNLISTSLFIPSLSDIAHHAHKFFSRTFDDFKFRVGPAAVFEAAIFGYCHKENKLSAFHFAPKEIDGLIQMTMTAYNDMNYKDFIYLGDHKAEMNIEIENAFSGESIPGRPISRIPRYVIQEKIDSNAFPSIGGDVQLAIADKFGFRPLTICKPRQENLPNAYMSYLGRELTSEISFVGEARVGMPGMA